MSGVSQQGKKRGRARNLMKKKDLNRGQIMGFGKAKMSWPGLSAKVTEGTGSDVSSGGDMTLLRIRLLGKQRKRKKV